MAASQQSLITSSRNLTEGNFCPSEVLLLVQEPHAWVARARLSGFPGASLDLPSARGLASLRVSRSCCDMRHAVFPEAREVDAGKLEFAAGTLSLYLSRLTGSLLGCEKAKLVWTSGCSSPLSALATCTPEGLCRNLSCVQGRREVARRKGVELGAQVPMGLVHAGSCPCSDSNFLALCFQFCLHVFCAIGVSVTQRPHEASRHARPSPSLWCISSQGRSLYGSEVVLCRVEEAQQPLPELWHVSSAPLKLWDPAGQAQVKVKRNVAGRRVELSVTGALRLGFRKRRYLLLCVAAALCACALESFVERFCAGIGPSLHKDCEGLQEMRRCRRS